MQSILNVNWDTADFKKIVADYFEMPDGSQRLVEMPLWHWYMVHFIVKEVETPLATIVSDVLDSMKNLPEADFGVMMKHFLEAYHDNWLELTEGAKVPLVRNATETK